ncbi:MAG: type II toxin-antitoxin system HicB family antitoxin [Candidatus Nomurabacteria bacterium]|nr:type II toxin-antitoxin system HicB family antitoxin [Candidatus Nomurabacteria bacterium]
MTKSYTFRTIIEPDGKFFHGYVPALLGCHTFGKTIEETKKFLNEAIQGYLLSCMKHGDTIPSDTGFQSIETVSIPIFSRGQKRVYA